MAKHSIQLALKYAKNWRHTGYAIVVCEDPVKHCYKYRNGKRSVFVSEKIHKLTQRLKNESLTRSTTTT